MSKKLISFRDKQRKRQQSRGPQRPRSGPPHEWDDLVWYWRRILQSPLQLAGRQGWTERMMWSNAILAGLIRIIGLTIMDGFHLLLILTTFVNMLFLAFLFYYGMTWVIDWVVGRTRGSHPYFSVADLRREVIVLSGWIVIFALLALIPAPFFSLLALLGFAAMLVRAVHQVYRVTWGQTLMASAAGILSIVAVLYILSSINAL